MRVQRALRVHLAVHVCEYKSAEGGGQSCQTALEDGDGGCGKTKGVEHAGLFSDTLPDFIRSLRMEMEESGQVWYRVRM